MTIDQPQRIESAVNWQYWLVVLATQLFVLIALPTQSYRAEMWFETGKNFFATAYHDSLWENILKTDAGYLPWLPRLVAVLVVKLCGCVQLYPVVVQAFSNLIFGLLSAHFCLRCFRAITPNDHVRFLVGLSFGCGLLSDGVLYSLYNMAYAGVPVLVLVLCLDLAKLSRCGYLCHLFLVPLLICSKGIFIAVCPLYVVAWFVSLWHGRSRELTLLSVAMLAIAAQAVSLKLNQKNTTELFGGIDRSKGLGYLIDSPKGYLQDLGKYYEETFPYAFLKSPRPDSGGQLAILLAVVCGGLIVEAARRGESKLLILTGACVIASVSSATILIVAHPFRDVPSGLNHFGSPCNQLVLLALFTLVASQLNSSSAAIPVLGVLIFAILVRRPEPMHDPYRDPQERHSQWKIYRFLVQPDIDYVIPVNMSPWVMSRNCDCVNPWEPFYLRGQSQLQLSSPGGPPRNWNVRAVMYEQPMEHRGGNQPTKLLAYRADGQLLGVATRLTPENYRYSYFWFPDRVLADKFVFADDREQPVAFNCEIIRIYGK